MIDRQELIALLDKMEVAPFSLRGNLLSFRETLADQILKLDSLLALDVADSGTVFPELKPDEYAGGYHYPNGASPGHPLIECNRRLYLLQRPGRRLLVLREGMMVRGMAVVLAAVLVVVGCKNQAAPSSLPDGVTPISENMLGFWNAPGGPGCKWSIRVKSGKRWVTVNSGGGNKSQSLIINHSMADVGQLRSDKCGGWTQ